MGETAQASVLEGIDLKHLTREEAEKIIAQGSEAIIFALLELSVLARNNGKPSPSTPSSQVPPYRKENTSSKRKKPPGRKAGHPGARRPDPEPTVPEIKHTLERCPKCGGVVAEPSEYRTRLIEDIPKAQPIVTKHVIPRCYCKNCKSLVEPVVVDALPGAQLGHRALVLSSWFHYSLGNTLSQITNTLDATFQFSVTEGGLVSAWHRMAGILAPWYEKVHEEALLGAKLHADETGYRVNGKTEWLWCFTNDDLTYYWIDPSRGEPALRHLFAEAYNGVLITDFWGPYDRILGGKRQKCLTHLLRELEKVDKRNASPGWVEFRDPLKRLLQDALRLGKREGISPEEFASKRKRLDLRLDELAEANYRDADAKRLSKRLRKYRHELFTFLDEPGIPPDNNHAEREIRPAVIMRKNCFHNMSQEGAVTQSIWMTLFRTLKRRGHNPVEMIVDALKHHVATGSLPPLPKAVDSNAPP